MSGFRRLLIWYLDGFRAETPSQVHVHEVYVARPARLDDRGLPVENVPSDLIGGSVLGTPRHAEPFRQLIENSPRQTVDDETGIYYARPMRAALARLGGKVAGTERWAMAQFLKQVAYSGGDWYGVGERVGLPDWARAVFTEAALRRLHRVYRKEPPLAWTTISESQQNAESRELR